MSATILGLITVNGKEVLEVDQPPMNSGGTPAPVGSIAMVNVAGVGTFYVKFGAADTDWSSPNPAGTANTFAGFNGAGSLESIPGFNIDTTTGGMNESFTKQPNNGGGTTLNNLSVAFDPLVNSPNETWNIQSIQAFMDNASSGFSQGTNGSAAQLLNLNFTHHGTGDTGSLNFITSNSDIGNGTDPITVKGMGYIFGFGNIHANVTLDGSLQGYGFQVNVDAAAAGTSNFSVSAFYDFANISIPVHGYNSFNAGPIIAEITNNNNYNGATISPTIPTLTGNAGLYGYGFYPNVTTVGATGQVVGLNMGPTITTLGTNANYQGITIGGTVATMGTSSNVNGFSWFPNITTSHGNINGIQINPTISGGDAIFTGIQISPNGGATLNNPQGIVINLNQINSTDPQGTTGIQSDSRLQVNAQTQLMSAQTFQIGSRIDHLFHVPVGSPVTGTDEIAANIAGDLWAEDDVANGAFGLGFNSVGFIASLAVSPTKTVDSVTVFLPACSLPDPGVPTGGNVTEFHMIREFAPLSQGGTLNITNLYGFKLDAMFGDFASAAANAWGIFLDTTAQNYIKGSLAIDTSTFKVSNASVGFEIGGTTKALRLPNLTTTQRNALTALAGMEIFNTTTGQVEFYDGVSWQAGGGGGSGGSEETAIINESQPSGTDGGTFTSGAWQTRVLNTVQTSQSWLALAANQFTLQPGTYFIEASAPALQVQRHKAKLRDITNSADALIGSSEVSLTSTDGMSRSFVEGIITVLVATTFEIQHQCQSTLAASGFGAASSFTVDEIYTEVKITKTANIASDGIFFGAACTTASSNITSAGFNTFDNSPTLTFTPTVTGTYKVYSNISLYQQSAAQDGVTRITNTVGGAALLAESQGIVYSSPSDNNATTAATQSVYTLIAGVSYSFDIQGKTTGGTGIQARGDLAQFYIFAELEDVNITGSGGGSTFNKETFVLSGTDITNQYIDLAQVATNDSIDFLIQDAGVMLEGASYEYSVNYTGGAGGKTRITFLNDIATAGVSALVAGDVVQVKYAY